MLTSLPLMMFRLADDFGSVLTGRSRAKELRERVEAQARQGSVVLDFEGISTVSPSFADELFAKMDPQLLDQHVVRFEHVATGIEAIAKYVISARQRGAVL
jgi:hypothetical protein